MSKKITKILAGIVLIFIGYTAGYLHGHHNLEFEQGLKPKIVNLDLHKPAEVDFSLFWDAYDVIKQKSFTNVDDRKGVYGAIGGLISSLGDPFSSFLDPTAAKLFTQDLAGSFGGIGAELNQQNGALIVVSPISGTPAQKAGLKPKDAIIKIDGKDTSILTFGEAIEKIRGAKGTSLTLTIVRQGIEKPFDVVIIRDIISVKSVSFEEKGDIGVLHISQFNEDTLDLIKQFKTKILSKKGLVIDLRNDPGGLLQTAIDTASLFDEKSPIVLEESKGGTRQEYARTEKPIFKDLKMVVLINEGSASASEIFAGALSDHGKAKLVGTKSFGKGSVQNLESLKDGSIIRITVAHWLTPNGKQIHGKGINPDIEIKNSSDRDDQMAKAIEILTVKQ